MGFGKQEILAVDGQVSGLVTQSEFVRDLMTTNGGYLVAPHEWGGDPAVASSPDAMSAGFTAERLVAVAPSLGGTALSR